MNESVMQCPSCPDGYVWDANGPTAKTCPTCGGKAIVNLDGSKVVECPHGRIVGYCNDCDIIGDLAFDAERESRMFRR